MQKVSKQSLAMLALSILLAVSIALTLTFAALADSKTATGTITFSEGGSVAWTYDATEQASGATVTDKENGSITFELTETAFDIAADGKTATLKEATTFGDAKVTFTNSSANAMYYRITIEYTGLDTAESENNYNIISGCTPVSAANIANSTATGLTDGESTGTAGTVTYTLDHLIGGLILTGPDSEQLVAIDSAATITITAEFQFAAF